MPLIRTSRGYPRVFGGDGASTPAPPAPWTPADLGADLLFWLDAQDINTLSPDGEVLVSANDDPVGLWLDKSPSGYHVSSTDNDFRPLYKTSGINGHPALLFDGSNDRLARTVSQPWDVQTGHVFAVIRSGASVTGEFDVFSSGDNATSNKFFSLPRIRNGTWRCVAFNSPSIDQLDTAALSVSTSTNYLVHVRSDGEATALRSNGTDVAFTAGTNTGRWMGDVPDRDVFAVGATGLNSTFIQFFNGHIGAILITNELSAENWGNMETWLSNRWGIALAE